VKLGRWDGRVGEVLSDERADSIEAASNASQALLECEPMTYFVVVPGALVPASIAPHVLARAQLYRLAGRLARARVLPAQPQPSGAAHLAWLWQRFGGEGAWPITAPYAWSALQAGGSPEPPGQLWHADPVHFAFARDHLLLTTLDADAAVSAEESDTLAIEAAASAAEFAATLHAVDPEHWFLSFDSPWPLEAVPFDAAVGRSVGQVLPEGAAAPRWRKLLTEIQMRWHQHPINERRDAAGVRTVNGLWLHGGGPWSALPNRPFESIAADDAVIRGWGLASGLPTEALLPAGGKPGPAASVLVYWPHLLSRSSHEDWDGWLQALTRFDAEIADHIEHAWACRFDAVALVLAGRETVRPILIKRTDRLKPWRRNRLPALFAAPAPA
jgi:hypothetical protein